MRVGRALFQVLEGSAETLEVYPHAIFRALNQFRPLPPKQTLTGARRRVELLRFEALKNEIL
jgi:hypothetical protein